MRKEVRGLTQGMNVSWSWAWNGVDRAASNRAAKDAISALFAGRRR